MLNVLILDDEEIIRTEVNEFLTNFGYCVFEAERPSAAMKMLAQQEIDILILDVRLPEKDGIDVLREVKDQFSSTEVIMITGHGDNSTVLECMNLGAFDFFHKPIRLLEIRTAIERTERYIEVQNKLQRLEKRYEAVSTKLHRSIADIIGSSVAMKRVIDTIVKAAAASDTSVLITGESGSGKELVARALHYASPRSSGPYVPVNCSAIPETLIESEFFGHRKGAFTGAIEEKVGYFELADGGTLFLDEIGDMPFAAQTKLLRVLEERKVKRVGGIREMPLDIRVVAATNQDIPALIQEKLFRQDLFYRINTLEIQIPPLRERKEDIEELIQHFIAQFNPRFRTAITGVANNAMEQLRQYDFPGNVRELRGMIERAMILSEGSLLSSEALIIPGKKQSSNQEVQGDSWQNPIAEVSGLDFQSLEKLTDLDISLLEEFENALMQEALRRCNHNKSKAARMLGISIHAFGRRLRRLGIQ